jgi:DNA-directed RNA polymerase specialized sigma24 family protein
MRVSALLAAARSGDKAAWSTLVTRIKPFLSALVPGPGIDPATGESIAEGVYARLSRELDGIHDEDSLITWVLQAVPRHTAGRYSEVDRSLSGLSATELGLLRLILRGKSSYADIANLLGMPVGSIGPTRQRLFRKIWWQSGPGLPKEEFDPRPDRGTTREDLEAALQVHRASHRSAPPERKNGRLRTLARAFGLVPPPWTSRPAGDDLVVAACQDVTDATRETFRDFTAVLSESAALAPEPGDRR